MYVRYIYKLSALHIEAKNYTEAAFTLLLHTELLVWSEDEVPEDESYPPMLEWQKKEQIYQRIIEYFDIGKVRRKVTGKKKARVLEHSRLWI